MPEQLRVPRSLHQSPFDRIGAVMVATYVETLMANGMAKPSVKQHLAAIRMMFDFMVTGGILPFNPAASVCGPKHVVKVGKTPVLQPDEARTLLDSIDVSTPAGLRDRALLGVTVYSFARVSAVVGMDAGDYYQQGKRWWLRLAEKGGKAHAVPAHHKAEEYLDAYLDAIGNPAKGPLWRSMTKERVLGENRMHLGAQTRWKESPNLRKNPDYSESDSRGRPVIDPNSQKCDISTRSIAAIIQLHELTGLLLFRSVRGAGRGRRCTRVIRIRKR